MVSGNRFSFDRGPWAIETVGSDAYTRQEQGAIHPNKLNYRRGEGGEKYTGAAHVGIGQNRHRYLYGSWYDYNLSNLKGCARWTDEEGNVGKASCFTREFSCSLYKDEGSSKVGSRSSLKEGMIGKKPIGEDSSPLTNKNLAEVKCGALYADNENARFSVKDEYRFTGEFEQDW